MLWECLGHDGCLLWIRRYGSANDGEGEARRLTHEIASSAVLTRNDVKRWWLFFVDARVWARAWRRGEARRLMRSPRRWRVSRWQWGDAETSVARASSLIFDSRVTIKEIASEQSSSQWHQELAIIAVEWIVCDNGVSDGEIIGAIIRCLYLGDAVLRILPALI